VTEFEIRTFVDGDREPVVDLLASALGRSRSAENDQLFLWKHVDNPAGRSIMLVAEDHGAVVGFRAMMRWNFRSADGRVIRAIRAVDTATDARWRGRGVFSALTMASIEVAAAEGVEFVFNTPNDQSRPGYLKLGWQIWGRPPVSVVPSRLAALGTVARSRVPAERISESLDGAPAVPLGGATTRGWMTDRTDDWYAWRYGDGTYRTFGDGEATMIARLRRRGASRELVVVENRGVGDRSIRRIARHAGATHAIRIGRPTLRSVPMPRGPLLTWRPVADASMARPPLELQLTDVELF
jgi:GNAT superfamily N-acetyltransferase